MDKATSNLLERLVKHHNKFQPNDIIEALVSNYRGRKIRPHLWWSVLLRDLGDSYNLDMLRRGFDRAYALQLPRVSLFSGLRANRRSQA